ncbi:hypothetical protein M1843_18935 [Isoptericola sp. 4D.3]|uniref:Uncharacterized protein n=1 Tax=Isoptericola peretonis TaxID=2918523 RepID=A0ABT0J8K9_9MICO|nr:hypothetical protein [Isoptericola sp. 4D.3]
MLQRILGGVLVLLGLAAAALGVASATVWRDTDTVVATATPTGDGTLVVTDPGVLGLVGGDVTVSATVPEGQKVTLAVGRDVDVAGWVGNDPYSRVTGLSDWENLSVAAGEPADAEAGTNEPPESGPDPAGSDMWVAEASDENSVTLRWSDRPGRWTLLAAGVGEGAQAPTLELTWPRNVTTPYLWPGIGVGVVLVGIGAVLLVLGGRRVRAQRADAADLRSDGGPSDGRHDDRSDDERYDDPSAGARSPFGPVAPGAGHDPSHQAGATPAPTAEEADEPGPTREGDDDGTARDAAGTAEVPLAGRLLRRSRGSRRQSVAETSTADVPPTGDVARGDDPAPVAAPFGAPVAGPVPAPAAPHEPVPAEPTTATGALRMTRRELRAQEEARRASEQGSGMTRMLRAMTGSIPAVRPQESAPAGEAAPARPDTSTPAGRAAAWRATWGFGDTRTGQGTDPNPTDTDGENR